MDAGLPLVCIGLLLVTSLLLRRAAAGCVTAEMVPPCLLGRLRACNRREPVLLALAACTVLLGTGMAVASQIATGV